MQRNLYTADHEEFRSIAVEFVKRVVEPHQADWDQAHLIDRDAWLEAGRQGIVGLSAPEEFGGAGQLRDYRYRQIVNEEIAKVGNGSLLSSFSLQDDILIPYIAQLGTDEQKQRWLPGMARGEKIAAVAMTEPGTGSDLRGIRTTAKAVDGGWVVNGSKTFITSGIHSDLVVTVVKTGEGSGSRDFSLLVIEAGMDGFERGRKLDKVGLVAQDTSELSFTDVFVPSDNLLGELGGGFGALMNLLPLERLGIAAGSVAMMQAAFDHTVEYVEARHAFGQPIMDFQNTRFQLADIATEIAASVAFLDQTIHAWNAAELTTVEASKIKLWATEALGRVVDTCVQLHGGYGYMLEYPIARLYQDARVQRIFGGTSEIMREIIGRDIAGRR